MKKLTISMILTALTMGGCGDDDRPGDIVIMDPDMGPDETDMGPVGTDMGPVSTCPPAQYPAPTEAACTMMQIDELQAAAGESQAALDMWFDDNPDCGACVNNGLLSCATMNGCDDEFGEVNCCGEDECSAAPNPQECFNMATGMGGACEAETNTFIMCVQNLPMGSCGIDPVCVM